MTRFLHIFQKKSGKSYVIKICPIFAINSFPGLEMCLFVCFNVFKSGQNFKTYDFSVNILPYIQFSERFYDTPLTYYLMFTKHGDSENSFTIRNPTLFLFLMYLHVCDT